MQMDKVSGLQEYYDPNDDIRSQIKKKNDLENIAQLKGLTIVAIKSIEYGSIFPLRRLTLLKVPFAPILSCLLNYEYISRTKNHVKSSLWQHTPRIN